MSATPPTVTGAHTAALREHLDDRQVIELTALVALENSRARFNDALGVTSQDFCAVPVPRTAQVAGGESASAAAGSLSDRN